MERNTVLGSAHSITKLELTQAPGSITRNIQQFINGLLQTMDGPKSAKIAERSAKGFIGLTRIINIGAFVRTGFACVLNAITIWIIDRWEKFAGQKSLKISE